MDFSYLLEKIRGAELLAFPFKHLHITNFFDADDFQKIVESEDILTKPVENDSALFDELFRREYRIIEFPGCTQDHHDYIRWHKRKQISGQTSTACEGYGVVLRLFKARSSVIQSLQAFLNSEEFIRCLAEKFQIDMEPCTYDAGIQKYLDGYEISPHPDVRRKALTYMVNINPNPTSSEDEYHTSFLQFNPAWKYVEQFWRGNEQIDRCWVPWNWCEVKSQQRENNSIVVFAPADDTMHAVKAKYSHLAHQRTQMYGNLWYAKSAAKAMPKWEDFVIDVSSHAEPVAMRPSLRQSLIKALPWRVAKFLRRSQDNSKTHGKRSVN